MSPRVVVLVPLHRDTLDANACFAIDRSIALLATREVRFICPERLGTAFYASRYPGIAFDRFAEPCFASIQEYNRMLLDPAFYARYEAFEFMLILQTDAIVLRDELDFWCQQAFDYVGAPWPKAYELFVNTGRFEGDFGKHVRVHVGNGGLSLRRNRACMALLDEFGVERELFLRTGSSEDLFFSVMGSLSNHFVVPNEITASRFSMEGRPSYYLRVNGGQMPMGAHAWEKNELEFWSAVLQHAP